MECGLLLRFLPNHHWLWFLSPHDIKMLLGMLKDVGANIRSFCLLVASSMVNNFSSENTILSSCWVASRVSRPLLLTSLFCIILLEREWTVLLFKDLRCKSFFTRFVLIPVKLWAQRPFSEQIVEDFAVFYPSQLSSALELLPTSFGRFWAYPLCLQSYCNVG